MPSFPSPPQSCGRQLRRRRGLCDPRDPAVDRCPSGALSCAARGVGTERPVPPGSRPRPRRRRRRAPAKQAQTEALWLPQERRGGAC